MSDSALPPATDFIRGIINADLQAGRHTQVVTRFPPEPNGYLHIGHAKSICLNFGLASDYENGVCHLRFDDTNPATEDPEFVQSIQADIRWLGFDPKEKVFFASDYYEQLYTWAIQLINQGDAYVCGLSEEDIREWRGTVKKDGRDSPGRDRTVAENLDLLARMRAGEFPDGRYVLRARIDMSSNNMKMRDPLLYRIRHAHHYRTGDSWCIYPMYDFAHCLSDALEGITHSICTLEFDNNRELYDWLVAKVGFERPPHQYEFARLNLNYTVMSKRKLRALVQDDHVAGWDDPRMPTLAGMRRRGITAKSIRDFASRIGIARNNNVVDYAQLEFSVRNDLNGQARRVMCVHDPLKLVLTNWDQGKIDTLIAPSFPHDVDAEGERPVPFTREIYIERSDFAETPPKGFRRLVPGGEVRLRYGYIVRCDEIIRDADGAVSELRCTVDHDSRGGDPADGRKVQGTVHWVSATESLPVEVRVYDRLFRSEMPDAAGDFLTELNPNSLQVITTARVEPSVANDPSGSHYQFERQGYYVSDIVDSKPGALVFNRTVALKDSWGKQAHRPAPAAQPKPVHKSTGPVALKALDPADQSRADALVNTHGLGQVEARALATQAELRAWFDEGVALGANPLTLAKWLVHTLPGASQGAPLDTLNADAVRLAGLVKLVDGDRLSSSAAKKVLTTMLADGGDPEAIMLAQGLEKQSDSGALTQIIDAVLAAHPDEAGRLAGGERKLLGFFMGQVMRRSGGKADPTLVRTLLPERAGLS